MAKITLMSGIASISGRVGNCCFRTMKATGKVYMHQVKANSQESRDLRARRWYGSGSGLARLPKSLPG